VGCDFSGCKFCKDESDDQDYEPLKNLVREYGGIVDGDKKSK
jgi:hypothetical protein